MPRDSSRRTSNDANDSAWDPYAGEIDRQVIERADAVINLSGASIAGGPWTKARRKVLEDSRVMTTSLLADTIANANKGPRVLLQASAIGFYGDRGSEELTEHSSVGEGFLAELCMRWENAAQAAVDAGRRVVYLRTGLVLAKDGGLLGKLLLPFKLGLGGPNGNGEQMMSWLTLGDLVEMIVFLLNNDNVSGPVNCVAPNPVSNREFTRQLGKELRRPTFLPVPSFPLRLVMGDMADEMILAGQHVRPEKLINAGYKFKNERLSAALAAVLR